MSVKFTTDTPAMIRACLSCVFPECVDCLGRNNAYSYGIRMDLDDEFVDRQAKLILKRCMADKKKNQNA